MTGNAVATPHALSASAGELILRNGGNAVDAAIAAVAAQGVVAPETCGVGGDLFALTHQPGWSQPLALNSSGRSGSNASPNSLSKSGYTEIPEDSPLVATIPGCVDGLAELSRRLGSLPLADCLQPAIKLASDGFEVSIEQAFAFERRRPTIGQHPAVSNFYPGSATVRPGDTVRRQALATTLGSIASGGRDAFYLGPPGEDIVKAVDGTITTSDLEMSQAEWIDPIGVEVGGMTAWTTPPNSQGYLGPATLAVLEMLSPPTNPEDPLWWHLMIEAYRSLAWERNDLVADSDHAPLPSSLLMEPARLERAADWISADKTGIWPRMGSSSGTAYLCTSDDSGMAVSIIQSNYRGIGSPFGAARSGFMLQDRGMGFSLVSGHPNELGPGKRPLHTLSPTIWTKDDQPRWLLGTRGGAIQPQIVAQVAARTILGDSSLGDAQAAPRWSVSDFGPFSEPLLAVEPGVSSQVLSGLHTRGHQIEQLDEPQPGWGPVSIIELDGSTRRTAPDPRVDTTVALSW